MIVNKWLKFGGKDKNIDVISCICYIDQMDLMNYKFCYIICYFMVILLDCQKKKIMYVVVFVCNVFIMDGIQFLQSLVNFNYFWLN